MKYLISGVGAEGVQEGSGSYCLTKCISYCPVVCGGYCETNCNVFCGFVCPSQVVPIPNSHT
jgi:hypothetical protein